MIPYKQQQLEIVYGPEVTKKIANARVLVVGAGGIGCEVMKCLSMTGFQHVEIIDMDTIDISNLNRQFLFRRKDVGQPKSFTVKQAICRQNTSMTVAAHNARIQESRYFISFFSDFDLVVNALDNEEARKYVNQLCAMTNKPLVDSGTNGYKMTCLSIMKGKTPCYECVERKKDQSFPVCTIRQKPEKLIHCVVWAKALFEAIFGSREANSQNIVEDIIEELDSKMREKDTSEHDLAALLIDRVFGKEPDDLRRVLADKILTCSPDEKKSTEEFLPKIRPVFSKDFLDELKEQDIASALEVADEKDAIRRLVQAIKMLRTDNFDQIGTMEFDKDIDGAVEFVTAATNLRAFNFSIPLESLFKIKEVAGKIVPAISSSNAMAASLQVFEAIKLLCESYKDLRGIVYQRTHDHMRLNSYSRMNEAPNPNCSNCSYDPSIALIKVQDLGKSTLGELVDFILEDKKLGFSGTFYIIEKAGKILFEFDEDQEDDEKELEGKKLPKTLKTLGFDEVTALTVFGTNPNGDDSRITVEVFEDNRIKSPFWAPVIRISKPAPKKKPDSEPIAPSGDVQISDDDSIGEIEDLVQPTTSPAKVMLGKRSPSNSEPVWDGKKASKIE